MSVTDLFGKEIRVINVGIATFREELAEQEVPVQQLNWTVPSEEAQQARALAKRLLALS